MASPEPAFAHFRSISRAGSIPAVPPTDRPGRKAWPVSCLGVESLAGSGITFSVPGQHDATGDPIRNNEASGSKFKSYAKVVPPQAITSRRPAGWFIVAAVALLGIGGGRRAAVAPFHRRPTRPVATHGRQHADAAGDHDRGSLLQDSASGACASSTAERAVTLHRRPGTTTADTSTHWRMRD